MKEYTTLPNKEFVIESEIKKSRFIAAAKGVQNVEEAMEFVNSKRKKYFDATHNCYAYLLREKAKFGDDGEPSGTAGLPILECIKNNDLDFVCVVVTRYFGGIKLGAAGLARAYGGSCAEALKNAEKVRVRDCIKIGVEIEYSRLKPLRQALAPYCKEESVEFDQNVRLVFLILSSSYDTISEIVSQITFGKAQVTQLERLLCPFD